MFTCTLLGETVLVGEGDLATPARVRAVHSASQQFGPRDEAAPGASTTTHNTSQNTTPGGADRRIATVEVQYADRSVKTVSINEVSREKATMCVLASAAPTPPRIPLT
jgi:hypothetical protein